MIICKLDCLKLVRQELTFEGNHNGDSVWISVLNSKYRFSRFYFSIFSLLLISITQLSTST